MSGEAKPGTTARDGAAGMRGITIEPAREDEIAAVRALADRIWRAHYPGIITDEQIDYMLERGYALERLREQVATPGHGLDLLKIDGAIAGFANWYVTDDPAEMKLDKLYLLQDFHGRGLGSRLIDHVAERARAHGCARLVLNVNKYNAGSIKVYERNGFAVREAVVVDIGQGFVMDDYVMVKPL